MLYRLSKRTLETLLVLVTVAFGSQQAAAQSGETIVAIVNDDVISSWDVRQRVNLVLSSSQIKVTDDLVQRVQGQVIRNLIDEKLQLQEGERFEVELEAGEIDEEIGRMARQNNMSVAQFENALTSSGVKMSTVRDQLKAELIWAKIVRGRMMQRVNVTDSEIDYAYNEAIARIEEPEYLVSEIYFDVDDSVQEQEVRANANQIQQQARNGVPFPSLAQQFSQSITAARGGDLGWIRADSLDPAAAAELKKMTKFEVSRPIRTSDGYVILGLRDKRRLGGPDPLQSTVSLKQVFIPVAPEAPESEKRQVFGKAEQMRSQISGCNSLKAVARDTGAIAVDEAMTRVVSELPGPIGTAVASLAAGQSSRPVASQAGIHVFVVCSRKDVERNVEPPTKDGVADHLFNQQLAMQAQRYIRDLRSDATIEIR